MAIVELNNPSTYEITALSHEMGRASELSFYVIAEDPDAAVPAFAGRTEVKFTVSGVVWFHGRTLPARRTIRKGREVLEYTAADPLEYLGNNPCALSGLGVSEWYNRGQGAVDVMAIAWPADKTVQQIIAAELAPVIGAGLALGALDFTYAGAAAQIIPPDFQTKGKTWLGLIEALVNESPGLGYWYDPTTIVDSGSPVTRGTLRFYDLSTLALSATRREAILPRRVVDPLVSPTLGANQGFVESVDVAEDITQSYDTVICRGWGDMRERYDQATPSWVALDPAAYGDGGPYLREKITPIAADPPYPAQPAKVKIQVFVPGPAPVAGGAWVDEDDVSVTVKPWHPTSIVPDYKAAGRRFKVPLPIVDLRITRKSAGSPASYVRDVQSMWTYSLQWSWYVGPLSWFTAGGTVYHSASFIAGIDYKTGEFSFGVVDDDGTVKPTIAVYGDPVAITTPRVLLPTPIAYDSTAYAGSPAMAGGFLLRESLMRRTNYSFQLPGSVTPPNHNYDNLFGQDVFKYYPTYDYVYLRYTGNATLESTKTDGSLGYQKTLLLHDQRLIKYTDHTGAVIKDDSAALSAAAQAIFDLVKRRRVYGSVTLHTDPATVMTDWAMGSLVRFKNWSADGVNYDPPAMVQGLDLSKSRDEWRMVARFDRQITFLPLERLILSRDFYEGDSVVGEAGLSGRRGHRPNPNPRPKSKKPNDAGASADPSLARNSSIAADPATPLGAYRGKITVRTTARGKCSAVGYTATTLDGAYTTPANSKPRFRQFAEGTVVFAAEVGSDCLIEVVPKSNNSGYEVHLLVAHERATQWFVRGHVTARTASQSTPPGLLYDWVSDDGAWNGSASRPLFAPYNDAPICDAAAVGSACSIIIEETASGSPLSYTYAALLWECQEKLHAEVCSTLEFIYNSGDGVLDASAIVVSPTGEEIVTPGYEVVVSDVAGWTSGVEPHLIVGSDYRVVYDPNNNAVVGGQQTDVAPGYYDDLLVSAYTFNTVVATIPGVSSVAAGGGSIGIPRP